MLCSYLEIKSFLLFIHVKSHSFFQRKAKHSVSPFLNNIFLFVVLYFVKSNLLKSIFLTTKKHYFNAFLSLL